MSVGRPPVPLFTRLTAHTAYDPMTDCWVCDLAPARGYPVVKWRGRSWRVSRLMYRLLVDADIAGLHVDHVCRNKRCWNPAHLEAVTASVNVQRERDSRATCRHGHPVSAWRLRSDGRRECVICSRAHQRERYRRRKGH